MRRLAPALALVVGMLVLGGCSAASTPLVGATVADAPTAIGVSDGDLWPSCWSDDDALYAANGDGAGFGSEMSDIVVNRITGSPAAEDLAGESLAVGEALGQVWTDAEGFTRKPTGMLCIDGTLYLAVQDLAPDFNAAPNATIARSDDHGRTWSWDTSEPMFSDGVFTTVWFADYGQDASLRPDEKYVYAYGLDGSWRDSFTDAAQDPTELFLARVPVDSLQDASTWEFFAGPSTSSGTQPAWTADISAKKPVLTDDRLTDYGMTVLSQGGVTYLPKRDRYLYTSWTEYTFEFYEAPEPWGPWTLFHSEDFGEYPWAEDRIGGYATTVPSKFVAEDEKTMWVQSNVCPCAPAGVSSYWFGLREMTLDE